MSWLGSLTAPWWSCQGDVCVCEWGEWGGRGQGPPEAPWSPSAARGIGRWETVQGIGFRIQGFLFRVSGSAIEMWQWRPTDLMDEGGCAGLSLEPEQRITSLSPCMISSSSSSTVPVSSVSTLAIAMRDELTLRAAACRNSSHVSGTCTNQRRWYETKKQ